MSTATVSLENELLKDEVSIVAASINLISTTVTPHSTS